MCTAGLVAALPVVTSTHTHTHKRHSPVLFLVRGSLSSPLRCSFASQQIATEASEEVVKMDGFNGREMMVETGKQCTFCSKRRAKSRLCFVWIDDRRVVLKMELRTTLCSLLCFVFCCVLVSLDKKKCGFKFCVSVLGFGVWPKA